MTQRQTAVLITTCAVLVLAISAGIRQGFGLFTRPVSADLELGRQVFSFAIAVQTLIIGIGNPFAGALADRFGTWRVAVTGSLLYVLGLLLATQANSQFGLQLTFGLIMGFALTAVSMSVMFGTVARVIRPEQRTLYFGLVTAGGSIGQFTVIPAVGAVLASAGWRETLLWMTAAAAVMVLLTLPLRRAESVPRPRGREATSMRQALSEARVHRGYWLLTGSYFVCGFHVSFMATHFPAWLGDRGMSPKVTATAFALIGLFNIFGSLFFGWLSGRMPKRHVLCGIYSVRALIFIPLLVLPTTPALALAFGAVMGFIFLGTVPPTSGIVAQVFGVRYMSTLFGFVFLSHQVGGFAGAWIAGLLYDLTGSYEIVWMINIALGVMAALLVLPIDEKPLERPASPATA